jgi:hypothetical protein
LQGYADDFAARFRRQRRDNRGIDAARHGNGDAATGKRRQHSGKSRRGRSGRWHGGAIRAKRRRVKSPLHWDPHETPLTTHWFSSAGLLP